MAPNQTGWHAVGRPVSSPVVVGRLLLPNKDPPRVKLSEQRVMSGFHVFIHGLVYHQLD